MTVSGFTMRRAERQLDQTLESQTQMSRSQDAIAGDGFGARAATKEADDGVLGSPRAERPELKAATQVEEQGSEQYEHSLAPYHTSPQVQRFQ
jgi:hypothetical protein